MDNELIETFFVETTKAFEFLETQYGYQRLERILDHLDDFRDAAVQVKYVGSRVGVGIGWGFAASFIGVGFVECLQPGVYPSSITAFPLKDPSDRAKSIGLYDLAGMLGHTDDPDFLLKNIDSFRTRNKRRKVIEAQMYDVLIGMARATQTYATPILQGDTTIFPQVMKFFLEKHKRLYPTMFLPKDVIDDPI